jgi:hypothetical protein
MRSVTGKHIDGSDCPEGTQRLPRRFTPCCEAFLHRTRACYFDIRYEWWPAQRGWFVGIDPSAGGGGIALSYCPHCGSRLGGIRRTGRQLEV